MTTIDELRAALGRVGIWMPPPAAIGLDPGQYARDIENAGFGSVWLPTVNTAKDLDALEPMLAATRRLVVGTGIASIWTWEPRELAARTDRLATAYPGRFILGLGVSHAPTVESAGDAYVRPLAKIRRFLDDLPETAAPLILAALGPKMLELSRDRALGAHPYFSPPEHTAFARSVLGAAPLLIPEQAVTLLTGGEGEAAARAYARPYFELPNYMRNLRKFGFGDEDLAVGGSQRLINTIIPNGPTVALTRIRQHLDAGADHVAVQLVGPDRSFAAGDLTELASLVTPLLG